MGELADLDEKKKKLVAIREKRRLLETKLRPGNDGSLLPLPLPPSSFLNEAALESHPNTNNPLETTQMLRYNTRRRPESEIMSEQPKEKALIEADDRGAITNLSDAILQYLPRLSVNELAQLTVMNTQHNSGYSCAIRYEMVYKSGPRPPSPNAKALSKLAAAAREQASVTKGHELLCSPTAAVDTGRRRSVQWKRGSSFSSFTPQVDSCPRAALAKTPHKPIIKVRVGRWVQLRATLTF
jgi:hypothetical protein